MLLYNLVNTTGEYIPGKTVVSLYERTVAGGRARLDESQGDRRVLWEFLHLGQHPRRDSPGLRRSRA
mgnify:CR=1 FL=1